MNYLEMGRLLLGSTLYHKSFRRQNERQPVDGSQVAMAMVDELATLPGPLEHKLLALYACGVHDNQKEVFGPVQVLAMMRFNDPYRPENIIARENGNAEGSFCYVSPEDKGELLSNLCQKVENFDSNTLDQYAPELSKARERLISRGVSPDTLADISDKSLPVYFLANEAQFLLKLIHPFWERNGRTSEEFMHLIGAMNGVDRLAFWDNPDNRYNATTIERMNLIDKHTMDLLPVIAKRMELNTDGRDFEHIDDLYKAWFEERGRGEEFVRLNRLRKRTPLKYLQSRAVFRGEDTLMGEYFSALRSIVKERIGLLDSDRFPQLLSDNTALSLVANQLTKGKRARILS